MNGPLGGRPEPEDQEVQDLDGLYPGLACEALPAWLVSVLPRDKDDFARVQQVVSLGYPAVAPIVPHLLTWLQDLNWPIAGPIARFLVPIGLPLVEPIHGVLAGDDDIWKHWVLRAVVAELDDDVVAELVDDLRRLVVVPDEEDVHLDAQEILSALGR